MSQSGAIKSWIVVGTGHIGRRTNGELPHIFRNFQSSEFLDDPPLENQYIIIVVSTNYVDQAPIGPRLS